MKNKIIINFVFYNSTKSALSCTGQKYVPARPGLLIIPLPSRHDSIDPHPTGCSRICRRVRARSYLKCVIVIK